MPTTTSTVIVELRRAALLAGRAEINDGQLLEDFVARRDECAFERLVHRHGPMVLGVCRRVIGSIHDAEDAFQATFLVLARKAASVRPREAVGNWLYGVAYRTARRAKAIAARRMAREKQVTTMPQPSHEPARPRTTQELEGILDEELTQLPDKYRLPVVLCELEGQPRKAVAQRLALPEGTLSSRLATARKLLGQRLSKRGFAVPCALLAGLLTHEAACASVPGTLVSNTVKAATLLAAGRVTAAVVSPSVAALSEGVLRAMFLTKLKIAGLTLIIALLLGLGVTALQPSAAAQPGAAPTGAGRVPQAAAQPKDKAAANKLVGTWKLISAKYGGEESALPKDSTTLKHMTPTHYMWVSYNNDGEIFHTGGGPYTFDGTTLKSTPEFGLGADFDAIKGKMQMYQCKIEGNRWHQSGTLSNGTSLEEVWERVEAKRE